MLDAPEDLISHPLAVSFTEPARLLGVEVKMLMANLAISFFLVLFAHLFWWAAVAFLLHFIMKWVTSIEPLMVKIYAQYQWQGDHYEPWCGHPPKNNLRPVGFARNDCC